MRPGDIDYYFGIEDRQRDRSDWQEVGTAFEIDFGSDKHTLVRLVDEEAEAAMLAGQGFVMGSGPDIVKGAVGHILLGEVLGMSRNLS